MLYVHEKNIDNKIENDYKGIGETLQEFKEQVYLPFRDRVTALVFDEEHMENFEIATDYFNSYYSDLLRFSSQHRITSQSKFASTFFEEISCYLFKDLPEIQNETFGVFNKGVYAGLKINNDQTISIIKKDVDFCIGKKVRISISSQAGNIPLIIPVVAVEVKTYLDATMFGEIKSSSNAIRSATPNAKTYVLMGYRDLSEEHIIAARNDAALTEMFALKQNETSPILSDVVYEYWKEIKKAVEDVGNENLINHTGRLLNR